MLLWNWLRNNSHYLLMLNHCLHSWWWQERWVAVFWFDLNKERGGDRDIAEFNFLFDCSLLGWLQIFSIRKKGVNASQGQAQNMPLLSFQPKDLVPTPDGLSVILAKALGLHSKSSCWVAWPHWSQWNYNYWNCWTIIVYNQNCIACLHRL